jgi:hypothetical protein
MGKHASWPERDSLPSHGGAGEKTIPGAGSVAVALPNAGDLCHPSLVTETAAG